MTIEINRLSPEWTMLKRWCEEEIDTNLKILEGRYCQPDEGHFLRGVIAGLRKQIAAVEDRITTPEAEGEKDYV